MDQAQTGTLAAALSNAANLLAVRPALAEEQASEILKVVPGEPRALLLLGRARWALGNEAGARQVLEPLARKHPDLADAHYALGEIFSARGEDGAAEREYARALKASTRNPALVEAANALCENRLAVAERLLRDYLKSHPTDIAAIRMLAETGARLGAYQDAETLLRRALELSPGFTAARHNLAMVLHRQQKSPEAIAEIDILLAGDKRNPGYRALRAAALVRIGEFEAAIAVYESLLKDCPTLSKGWMSYGHTLKTVGRQDDSVAAYRKSLALEPGLGETWWSLANLKTFRFTADDIAAMRKQLARSDISDEDRFHLHFALGKALEDEEKYEESFAQYRLANTLRRKTAPYEPEALSDHLARTRTVFTPEFVAARNGTGSGARDPIFVVSMPRAGSTLIEQILSSHSQVEGTMELSDIAALVRGLDGHTLRRAESRYPQLLADVDPARFKELGEEYLARTRVHRKLGRPFFVDKMPNNFLHVGFIHLILPNARIVDARRHPMACCLSNFKQHFARGQTFSYGLADLGRYWRDYASLMAHFDTVLPGRVHRVFYEDMVADPENQIRRLLDHCGLLFEEQCLRFHETERAVRTASSEQVRRPIFTDGVEQWRKFEPWLSELRDALGDAVEAYPGVPEF
jgi:tetratricopeptide (TPR) repeat protein